MKEIMRIVGGLVVIALTAFIVFYFVQQAKMIETSMNIESILLETMKSGENYEVVEIVSNNNSGDTESGEVLEVGENTTEEDDLLENNSNEVTASTSTTTQTNAHSGTKKLTSNNTYYIKVNNAQNVVTIYTKDEAGNYTVPYKAMLCSVGDATPKAGKSYKTTSYKNRWNALQGNVYGQYATQIVGNILFHSVPYTEAKNNTLEYWEYDKLGTAASLGCVRLTVQDAKWIYDNINSGTIVEFYEDDVPGPLGKPVAQKISDNEECRDWDPTDTAEGNPWNQPKEETIPNEIENLETISGEEMLPQEEEVSTILTSGEEGKSKVPGWLKVK